MIAIIYHSLINTLNDDNNSRGLLVVIVW